MGFIRSEVTQEGAQIVFADVFAGGFAALKLDGANPRDPAIARMLGVGQDTNSGVRVDAERVLGLPAVYRGVSIICNGVAKARPIIYKRTSRGKERAIDHPAYRLVTRKANRWMRASQFRKTLTAHKLLWGNGFAHVRRDGAGRALEYMPLLPDRTGIAIIGRSITPDSGIPTAVPDGAELMYWTRAGSDVIPILPDNILHIKGLGFNGLLGYSVIVTLAETFGIALAAREFGARFFGHGAVSSGIVFMPPGMQDEQVQETFAKGVRASNEGLGNSHRLMILEDGAKFEGMTIPPEAAQFLQTREFETREIAAAIGVQPHKLGDPTRKSYNSLEQSNQEHLDDDLDPHLQDWEEAIEETSLSETEQEEDTHFVECNRKALMRTDLNARSQHYNSGLQNGYYCINDVRGFENLDDIGPDGDEFRVQMQMVPVSASDDQVVEAENVPPSETDNNGPGDKQAATAKQMHDLLHHECQRFIATMCKKAEQATASGESYIAFLDRIVPFLDSTPLITQLVLRPVAKRMQADLNRYTEPPYSASDLKGNVAKGIESIKDEWLRDAAERVEAA